MPRGSVLATLPENLVITLDSKSPPRGDRTGLPSATALSPSKKAVGFEPGTKKKVGTSIRFLANFGAELKGFWELHHCSSYYREL